MGRNMPSTDTAALVWLEGHIVQWTASAATIGLTDGQTTDLAAKITDARNSFTSVEQIRFSAPHRLSIATRRSHEKSRSHPSRRSPASPMPSSSAEKRSPPQESMAHTQCGRRFQPLSRSV